VGKVVDGGVRGLDRGIITKIGGALAEGFRLWRTNLHATFFRKKALRPCRAAGYETLNGRLDLDLKSAWFFARSVSSKAGRFVRSLGSKA
jgi:hypothetical protein